MQNFVQLTFDLSQNIVTRRIARARARLVTCAYVEKTNDFIEKIFIFIYACMCACVYVCMCVCVYVCMCVCVYVCMNVCIYINVRAHTVRL
jgi:hypothetical protein